MEDKSKIIMAAAAGAVIGAGLALLFAPASGKETRENIADKLKDAKDSAIDKGKELKDKVTSQKA